MAKVAEFAPVEKESMYEQAKKQKEEKENSAETKKIKRQRFRHSRPILM